MAKVIQFMHPGAEHSKVSGKKWNTSTHKRKFMVNNGSILIGEEQICGELEFWGEYEPPAELLKEFEVNSSPNPKYLWKPLPIASSHQYRPKEANTDPYIFGCFAYTICKKFKKINKGKEIIPTVLNKDLDRGDIILFGSSLGNNFVLDTLFVVGRAVEISEENCKELRKDYGETFIKAALDPVFKDKSDSSVCGGKIPSCGKSGRGKITIHFGATYDNPVNGMYSFVPARLWKKDSLGFPRPAIKLENISPKAQNYRYCVKSNDFSEVFNFWMDVKREVEKAGLFPAIHINMKE